MPIVVDDYTWRQTDNMVVIRVPLKGVSRNKVDVFSDDIYIKVTFYVLIINLIYLKFFLSSSVNEGKSECTISEDEIVFQLHKMENGTWEKLEADLSKEEN
ncbi:hypothetical protein L9F63_001727, partial [Diploptera punctata]